ncbi:MAG: hypothetical protein NTZ05_12290 [Chloroflexi bacterium]|nr:hypothetical protein [Chloroflexota bacterium]
MTHRQSRRLVERQDWAAVGKLAAGTLAMWLAVSAAHELIVIMAAWALAWAAEWAPLQAAAALAPGDDLHAQLALHMIGALEVRGLALGAPGGDMLAALLPDLFVPPSEATGDAWLRAVFAAGSSAIGLHVARLLANVIVAVAGTGLVVALLRRRRGLPLAAWSPQALIALAAGVLLQAYGAVAQLHLAWSEDSGGHMMLSMMATKLLGLDGAGYDRMAAGAAGALLSFGINLVILALIAGPALILAWRWRLRASAAPGGRSALMKLLLPANLPGPAPILLALALFQTPLTAAPCYEALTPAALDVAGAEDDRLAAPASGAVPDAAATFSAPAEGPGAPVFVPLPPSRVMIERLPDGYAYQVNGARQWIRGIGYNPVLPAEDQVARKQRYDRDFAAIQEFGANTVIGWDQTLFDNLLLDAAQRRQLGVVMPFELSPTWNYSNPVFRQGLLDMIDGWVTRYRLHPAMRMWGLGNEVVHGIKDVNSIRARDFSRFLVEAADLIRLRDPNHPVMYRDAEDVYLAPVARALTERGGPRPWFVYGMNFFTYRLQAALTNGPASRLPQPLFVSEFAPAGLRAADRPAGYLKLWGIIRESPQRVLGGSAYVWTTDGPEPLDRSFGLVDASGAHADGSLAALGAAYLKERRSERTGDGALTVLSHSTLASSAEDGGK